MQQQRIVLVPPAGHADELQRVVLTHDLLVAHQLQLGRGRCKLAVADSGENGIANGKSDKGKKGGKRKDGKGEWWEKI